MKGAPPTDIMYRLPPQETPYFFMRYYPQVKPDTAVSLDLSRRHFETHSGVYHLADRLVFSFILSIAQTSKSAVVRRRILHRIATAFRITLIRAGPGVIPPRPMNILLTPRMAALTAPFKDLERVAIEAFWRARKTFEAFSEKKQASMTPRRKSEGAGKHRPNMKGDRLNLNGRIASTIRELPKSPYLDSHGGSKLMLQKLREASIGGKKTTVQAR